MLFDNAIIGKEFIQAANRRRMYVLRTAVPVAAMAILIPQLHMALRRAGAFDWRSIAQIVRPMFETCAWVQLVGFGLAAFVYGTSALHREWVNRTMEVLCASPLSRRQIIYGKFIAVLSKLVLLGLALLPITGLWLQMGRIPTEIALGSMAVIAGSTIFFGAAALLQSCAFPSTRGNTGSTLAFFLPYFLVLILLDAFVLVKHPFLEAAISPRALYLVIEGQAPGKWSTSGFALLSLGIHAGLSLLALGAAPALFERSFRAYIGGGRAHGPARLLRSWGRGRRRPLGAKENPFCWQERGEPTRMLRWALWVVYGVGAVFAVAVGLSKDFGFLADDEFYVAMLLAGIGAISLAAAVYGARVFAREKSHRRAEALLLTGRSAAEMMVAKVRAAYRALWLPLVALSVLGIGLLLVEVRISANEVWVALVFAQLILLGPAAGVIIGMVFGMTARSSGHALLGLCGTVVWVMVGYLAMILVFTAMSLDSPIGMLLFFVLAAIAMALLVPRWSPWTLGVLLALAFYVWVVATVSVAIALDRSLSEALIWTVCLSSVLAWLLLGAWFWMGLRLFDQAMSGQAPRLRGGRAG